MRLPTPERHPDPAPSNGCDTATTVPAPIDVSPRELVRAVAVVLAPGAIAVGALVAVPLACGAAPGRLLPLALGMLTAFVLVAGAAWFGLRDGISPDAAPRACAPTPHPAPPGSRCARRAR